MSDQQKPSPAAEGLSAPFWEGTQRGELVIQACADCGALRHYPQYLCPYCHSDVHDWQTVAGRGEVHSWTVSHHAFHPAFAAEVPYALVTVDLDAGVRLLGRWHAPGGEGLAMGLPVKLRFAPRADGFADPTFEPA